jgi:release factor glutamine methyltransferase
MSLQSVIAKLRAAGCVYAEDEAQLLVSSARTPHDLAAMVDQRASGIPLEHVLGWADFCGLRIAVDPGVFVPRRRTEFLVRQAAALARPGAVVVDLCCGSGALGMAVTAQAPQAVLYAADRDPIAVECARQNLGSRVYQGDLYAALPVALRGRVDVLLANVPYVATPHLALLPAEAREYEPRTALDGGADGLDVFRRVAVGAPRWLSPGGVVLSEVTAAQADAAMAVVRDAGLRADLVSDDDLEATVVLGRGRGVPPTGALR